MSDRANTNRYNRMKYNRCGESGLLLPAISLGLWQNFGHVNLFENIRSIARFAFDNGITHFDLANNYGPPAGSAEENMGRLLREDFRTYRDELIISSKAGYYMWPGPYGDNGSRKYLIASCEQSLKRMGVDYVDIFYSHRPDPETPVEETMMALDQLVRQGKALYVGLSNYNAAQTEAAYKILAELKTPFIIHQPRYNIFDRFPEGGLLSYLEDNGIGAIAFSPLAQGLLTDKYLQGIPANSRAASEHSVNFNTTHITEKRIEAVQKLNELAQKRGQTMAQMALSWVLHKPGITSVLAGASSIRQLEDNIQCLQNQHFSKDELKSIEKIVKYVKQ
jgi:L-glyceraldehyde 3-phosphate reductase